MLKRIYLACALAVTLLAAMLSPVLAGPYPQAIPSVAALQALGGGSAQTAHATVGGLQYDWVSGTCTPDGSVTIAATNVPISGAGAGCWVAPLAALPPPVRAGPAAIQQASLWNSGVAWGTSFVQGVGGQTPFTTTLAIMTGRPFSNQGAGGQTSKQVAVREGASNSLAIATVIGGAVPASGGAAVTFATGYEPLTNQGPNSLSASIGGVPGTLSWLGSNIVASISGTTLHVTTFVNGTLAAGQAIFQGGVAPQTFILSQIATAPGDASTWTVNNSQAVGSQALYTSAWTFTRTAPGSNTPVSTPTQLVVNVGTLNQGAVILWIGRNNLDNPTQIMADLAAIVATLGGNQNYLILTELNGDGEGTGTSTYNAIADLSSREASAYPGHVVDVRGYLANAVPLPGEFTLNCATQHCTTQGMIDAGLSPTTQDFIDIGNNIVPLSLRFDVKHPNSAANGVVAQRVALALSNSVLAMFVGCGTTHPTQPVDCVTPAGEVRLLSNGGIDGGAIGGAWTLQAGAWSNGNVVINPIGGGEIFFNLQSGTSGIGFGNGGGAVVSYMNNLGQLGLGNTSPSKMLTIVTPGTTTGEGILVSSNGAFLPTITIGDNINSSFLQLRIAGGGSVLAQIGGPATASGLTDIQIGTDVTGSRANAFLDVARSTTSATLNDALTSTVNYPMTLSHSTSGTAAAGFGTGIPFTLQNAAGTLKEFGEASVSELTATAGAEDGLFQVQLLRAGTLAQSLLVAPGRWIVGAQTDYAAAFATGSASTAVLITPGLAGTAGGSSVRLEGDAATPTLLGIRAEGLPNARTAVAQGSNLLAIGAQGWNGSANATTAQFLMTAAENFVSTTNRGTNINVQTTAKGAGTPTTTFTFFGNGHVQFLAPAPPVLSSCGTSPTLGSGSTDTEGYFTEGSGATGCTVTFAGTYPAKPACTITSEAGLQFSYVPSTTGFVITDVGALASTTFHYQCAGTG